MKQDRINKILSGKASKEEREAFFYEIKYDKSLADMYAEEKADYVFSHLPYTQDQFAEDSKGRPERVLRKVLRIVTGIAAVLMIPLLGYFVYDQYTEAQMYNISIPTEEAPSIAEIVYTNIQNEPMIKYEARTGVIAEVILPDSSLVWLNSGSTIEFPAKFDSVQRVVNFYGEGYFDIKGNPDWPMKINTSNSISVIVKGTEFNLNNYQNSAQFKLALVKGNVAIYRGNTNSVINVNKNDEIIINKGQTGKTSACRIVDSDIPSITAWKRGILKFNNTLMTDVVATLNNWYGYNIIIYNSKIKDYRFTGEFHSESLMDILETIKISSNIKYSIMNKDVVIY